MEAVASQPPVAPGGSVDVTPVAGGTSMTALPSAMKELARFFLNLSGSSSLGASGDSAGVTASGAALGDSVINQYDCFLPQLIWDIEISSNYIYPMWLIYV